LGCEGDGAPVYGPLGGGCDRDHENVLDAQQLRATERRGWLLVGALSVTVTVAYGVLQYAFGVLLPFMHQDLEWSRTAITGAFSLALLVSAVLALQSVGCSTGTARDC
jgi:hypothetical protein